MVLRKDKVEIEIPVLRMFRFFPGTGTPMGEPLVRAGGVSSFLPNLCISLLVFRLIRRVARI